MPYVTISGKKFLDAVGTGHLWDRIKQRYDSKLDSVVAGNDAVSVSNNNEISIVISAEPDNALQLKTTGNKGLYVAAQSTGESFTYNIVKDTTSPDYAAVYHLTKTPSGGGDPVSVGAAINIPKDMVVQSGTVETKSTAGAWGPAGTYIHLVLANADSSDLYINVSTLIEYVTSGSQTGDMVMIYIDPTTHVVTASLSDDSITAQKLVPAIRTALSRASSSVQSIAEGSTNGTISVDGTEVAVHGLGTAAYASSGDFDAAGSAAAVLGTNADDASTATVFGVKQYASDVYEAIQALTNSEIDAAIADAVTP